MKHNRAGQAASVVRAPTFVDIDPTIPVSWIRQCEKRARERIDQGFREDKSLLEKPKIRPFDPREDRAIRDQLRKASITQRITAILPNAECYAPTERVEAVASNDEMTVYDPVQAARVDPNATVPIPVYS